MLTDDDIDTVDSLVREKVEAIIENSDVLKILINNRVDEVLKAQGHQDLSAVAPEMLEIIKDLIVWEFNVFGGSDAPCWGRAHRLLAKLRLEVAL